jgi:hypothetical protein
MLINKGATTINRTTLSRKALSRIAVLLMTSRATNKQRHYFSGCHSGVSHFAEWHFESVIPLDAFIVESLVIGNCDI